MSATFWDFSRFKEKEKRVKRVRISWTTGITLARGGEGPVWFLLSLDYRWAVISPLGLTHGRLLPLIRGRVSIHGIFISDGFP